MNDQTNPVSPITPEQQADDRLMHALLMHMHEPNADASRQQRINQVVRAINQPQTHPTSTSHQRVLRLPLWARRSIGAVAAVLLIAVGFWALTTNSTPAMAALNEIIDSLAKPGDRTFHIQMVDLPQPPDRAPETEQERIPKPNLNDATLYLRNGRAYVLARHDPNSEFPILDGYDGQNRWRMHRGVLDETQNTRHGGGIPMPSLMADVPFSDLNQTLERIRRDYKVEQLDQAALVTGGELLRHIRVRRNSRSVKGPETIDLWADINTAALRKIVFDHAKIQGNRAPCRIVFDLVSDESLASNWFTPSPHLHQP